MEEQEYRFAVKKEILLLAPETIDQIAAGEVIERPSSVVKELVENAIDAGANAVTIELKEGGLSLIRITDNGEGIDASQVRSAFLRHATSKIRSVDDLLRLHSLGFRGEALSSIAAVCQVELITKCPGQLTGVRYVIEGGKEQSLEEIGAPDGSTFLVRNLFYNTPARKKFLKSAVTEGGYVSDLTEHLALSHPEVSFKLIVNGQTKLYTSGNRSLKDVIYHLYGREIAANVIEIDREEEGIRLSGFIGKPSISRGNRNYESYFVNDRYLKSSIVTKAIEEGYKTFLMQHRYPFTALKLSMDAQQIDVNVHPTKMDVRFADNQQVFRLVSETIKNALSHRELIPRVSVGKEDHATGDAPAEKKSFPEPFEANRRAQERMPLSEGVLEKIRQDVLSEHVTPYARKYPDIEKKSDRAEAPAASRMAQPTEGILKERTVPDLRQAAKVRETFAEKRSPLDDPSATGENNNRIPSQLSFFDQEHPLLTPESRRRHRLIGQLFDTYWLIEFENSLYIVDQHAAHEKVMYERLVKKLEQNRMASQQISPPTVLSLTAMEAETLKQNEEVFRRMGFAVEPFGGREYAITAAPDEFCSIPDQTLFTDLLDGLSEMRSGTLSEVLAARLATMACKSAVKGNTALSAAEADALLDELLGLENPYNCPHGRPTIIAMTKQELEKKFKRIL